MATRKTPAVQQAAQPFPVAEFSEHDAYAIKALSQGVASQDQQLRALKWIVNGACMFTSQSIEFGNPDRTAFNEGRRNVAKQILHLTVWMPDKKG